MALGRAEEDHGQVTGPAAFRLSETDREAFAYFRGNVSAVHRARPPCPTRSPRPAPATRPPNTDPEADAMMLLVALATALTPLTVEALTRALGWRRSRTHAALRHLHDHPRIGGPMALRRILPNAYTLAPRLDVLDREQHQALTRPGPHRDILAEDQAAALHTVIALGYLDGYLHHPSRNPTAEYQLEQAGLIRRGDAPAPSTPTRTCCSASAAPATATADAGPQPTAGAANSPAPPSHRRPHSQPIPSLTAPKATLPTSPNTTTRQPAQRAVTAADAPGQTPPSSAPRH
jgi:hypothetical protein